MRRLFLFIFLFLMTLKIPLNAQVSISASDTIGCDTLNALFYLSPTEAYDTISSISWHIDNVEVAVEDSLVININNPGYYRVSAFVNGLNSAFIPHQDVYVVNSPLPEFLYRDTSVIDRYTYIFKAYEQEIDTLSYTYEWIINGQNAGNSQSIVYSFSSTGEFPVQLKLSHNLGCTDSTLKTLIVSDYLVCPNVFTPNMDGFNDHFRVKTNGVKIYSFSVFSRSGIKVYESESPAISWDGRSLSGVEMQPGVYYYIIEEINGKASESITGFVHLIR